MNVPVPEIDALDLRLLISLAEGETLAGAARHLSLSPSAVSHRLTRLGQRLGIRLTGNSATRAPKWVLQEALPWLKASLANLEQARQILVAPRAEHHAVGIARLFAGWAETFLPRSYGPQHLGWTIHTGTSEEIVQDVARGLLTAGLVRTDHGFGTNISLRVLYQDPLLAVARPDVIARLTPSLESWPWIGFSPNLGHGNAVRDVFAKLHLQPWHDILVDSLESARALILAGRGIAVMPQSLVRPALAGGSLAAVPTPGVVWPRRTVAMAFSGAPPEWVMLWGRRLAQQLDPAAPAAE